MFQLLVVIQISKYHKHFCVTHPEILSLVGGLAGAGAAPSHPGSGSSLCGELRPPQRRAHMCVRQTRPARRAAERSRRREGLRRRNESTAQNVQ